MQIVTSVAQARALFDALPRPLGFVPTMGALHDGHVQLLRYARERSALGGRFDLRESACSSARARITRAIRAISKAIAQRSRRPASTRSSHPATPRCIRPDSRRPSTSDPLRRRTKACVRPHHFSGVATVVAKLLHVVRPDVLYLGQKDAQQTCVLQKMISRSRVRGRRADRPHDSRVRRLAMSSRNAYLDARAARGRADARTAR